MTIEIIQLTAQQHDYLRGAAAVLSAAFQHSDSWRTLDGSLEEVMDVLAEGVAFVAVERDQVIGWVGALPEYNGDVWELHPLAVNRDARHRDVGRALVERLEAAARDAGVWTMMLGTDDEDGRSNLSQIDDLYAEMPGILSNIRSLDPANPHPVDFYRKLGYRVIGILPDANGARRPDIYMAKSMRSV